MTDTPHAERGHATWSASATERLWACPGSLALTIDLPETTSEAADWGTCAHEIGEALLFDRDKKAIDWIGKTLKGKEHSFEVDEEMAETAQIYADYCWGQADTYKLATGKPALRFVEERFSLAKLSPPFDAGGISDHVIIYPEWKLIEVIDLKGGRGHVVEAKGNPQGRTYALGAMLAHEGAFIERIKVTIVQPRAPHKDGRIRSDEFHVADLVEWTADLREAMERANVAIGAAPTRPAWIETYPQIDEFDTPTGKTFDVLRVDVPPDWASAYLKSGDHCKFCKAKATCPAIEKAVQDRVGLWFEETGEPKLANMPDADDPAKLASDLDALDMIEGWCNARREHAHRLAEAGVDIPGYVLVEKQGREKFIDDSKVLTLMDLNGVPDSVYLNDPKLRTPKQVRAALKKAGLSVSIDELAETPSAGTNLVRADKTSRQPVQGTTARYFEQPSN